MDALLKWMQNIARELAPFINQTFAAAVAKQKDAVHNVRNGLITCIDSLKKTDFFQVLNVEQLNTLLLRYSKGGWMFCVTYLLQNRILENESVPRSDDEMDADCTRLFNSLIEKLF